MSNKVIPSNTKAIQKTGERQIAACLSDVREDHLLRYKWALEQIPEEAKVIDAGCGIGYGSSILAEKTETVFAIDVSADVIAYAKRFWTKKNIKYDVQDIHFLELKKFPDADFIVAFEVIEHLIEPRLFLLRAYKYLKPGGVLFLSMPNERKIQHSMNVNPFHFQHYTAEEVLELLGCCGFEIEIICQQGEGGIADGEDGNFHIVKAIRSAKPTIDEDKKGLLHSAFLRLNTEVNERSICLSQAQKNTIKLKKQIDAVRSMGLEGKEKAGLSIDENQNLISQLEYLRERERGLLGRLDHKNQQSSQLEVENKVLLFENSALQRENREQEKSLSHAKEKKVALKSEAARMEKLSMKDAHTKELLLRDLQELDQKRQSALLVQEELRAVANRLESERDTIFEEKEALEKRSQELAQEAEDRLRLTHETNNRLSEECASLRQEGQDLNNIKIDLEKLIIETCEALDGLSLSGETIKGGRNSVSFDGGELETFFSGSGTEVEGADWKLRQGVLVRLSSVRQRLEYMQGENKRETTKAKDLKAELLQHREQLDKYKTDTKNLNNAVKKAREDLDKSRKRATKFEREANNLGAKTVTISKQYDSLRSTNEQLAIELQSVASSNNMRGEISKETPSVGYLWRKLKYHRFYMPFLMKSVRNSIRLKPRRRKKQVK